MKHSVWDKLLLSGLSVLCMCIGILFFAMAVHLLDAWRVADFILRVQEGFLYAVLFALIGVLLFALPLRLIYVFLFKRAKVSREESVLIRKGENGSLQISTAAVDTIVGQYCKKRSAISTCTSSVVTKEEQSTIKLQLSFAPDTDIGKEISEIQEGLREQLMRTYGMQVAGVDVTVVPASE